MLNHKDSEDLMLLEFPEIQKGNRNFTGFSNYLASETNKSIQLGLIRKAQKILNFTHYLFLHSSKYVQLQLVDQYYKKLDCVRCHFNFKEFTPKENLSNLDDDHLPFKISYRLRNFNQQMQLTLITIK